MLSTLSSDSGAQKSDNDTQLGDAPESGSGVSSGFSWANGSWNEAGPDSGSGAAGLDRAGGSAPNELPATTFSGLLRQRRRQMGFSLAALAELAGCTKGYLSAIETGKRAAPPSPVIVAALEAALALRAGELALLAQWHATPGAVKEAMAQMNSKFNAQQGAARALAVALRSSSLDDLHKRGDLRRLIDRIDTPMPAPGDAVYGRVYGMPSESFLKEREEFEFSLEQP